MSGLDVAGNPLRTRRQYPRSQVWTEETQSTCKAPVENRTRVHRCERQGQKPLSQSAIAYSWKRSKRKFDLSTHLLGYSLYTSFFIKVEDIFVDDLRWCGRCTLQRATCTWGAKRKEKVNFHRLL